jgi:predicted outer membrane repeat protein
MANHLHKLLSTVSVLPALLVLPAFAAAPNTDDVAFLFGDVAITGQSTIDKTAFGGRRMERNNVAMNSETGLWTIVEEGGDNKYRNEFPNYQMVGRSFSLANSVAYVGPVTLTLRELTEDDHLAYNWAGDGVHAGVAAGEDVDLAAAAGVDFGDSPQNIYTAVANVIGGENAAYTAEGVIAFANLDSNATAGLLNFDSVNAVVDGATVNADAISVTNGSNLTFVKQNPSSLTGATNWYTNPADISSTGVTTLNARTINIDGSRMIINQGAELIVNADEGATFQNSTVTGTGGAIYNQGSVTLNNATFGGIDNTDPTHPISLGNTASGRGGAIYSTGALTINDSFFIGNSSTGGDGGAIAIKADDAPALSSITNTSFIGNTALGTVDSDSGAISVINGDLTISGSTFTDNQAKTGGALYAYKGGATTNSYVKVTISNSTFSGNQATGNNNANSGGGAIGNVALNYRNDGDAGMWISNTLFENNASTISNVNGGGAIFAGSESRTNISNNTRFIGNTSASSGGAIGTRNFNFGENHSAVMDITGATFTGNTAATTGGAIDNNFYNSDTMTGFVYINNSLFGSNTAANGGAIYNHISQVGDANQGQIGSMYFEDTNFADNIALANGGAIYNEGVVVVAANNADVSFSGNTANSNANDIYNTGSLTLTATNGQMISLEGGIDGASGTLNINGAGTVNIANALKNQTVTHTNGELHLYDTDLTGSTIAVSSGATLNTIDGLINNYMSAITLADGAYIMGDIDLTGAGSADTYSAVNGANITYTVANALNLPDLAQAVSPKTIQVTNTGATVNAGVDFHWYDSVNGLSLTSGGEGTGSVVVQGFSGGINAAVDVADSGTGVHNEIAYFVTADETFDGFDNIIQNTNFVITGNGIGVSDNTLTLASDLVVDDGSLLSINDAILAQANDTEKIENRLGAVLNINNSFIGVDIDNAGVLLSDPTTYTGTINNTGTANFAADTFDTTAVLANSGVANLANGVGFNSGATITGSGVINLISGTTHFNNTASSNTINLSNGADFDGVLASTGIVNTQNSHIDGVTGSVTGGTLNVDASLIGAGTVDSFADATGAKIGSINLIASEYGNAQSLTLDVHGATLSDDLEITGATNYYTSIALDDSGNLVFSDKLLNTSGFYTLADANWSNGHYILDAANYSTEADEDHLTIGDALMALDTQVYANTNALTGKVDTTNVYTGAVADSAIANSDNLVMSVTSFQNSITNLTENVSVSWAQTQGFDGGITIGENYGITSSGVATLGATTVSSMTMGGVTASGIDTTVGAHSGYLVTSGAVESALSGKQDEITSGNMLSASLIATDTSHQFVSSSDVAAWNALLGTDEGSVSNQIETAINNAGIQTASDVSNAIADNAQNATYDANGTYDSGTIGAAIQGNTSAIETISTLLGHASDTSTSTAATGLFASVEANTLAIEALTGSGEGSIADYVESALENVDVQTAQDVADAVESGAENATYTANANSHTTGTIGAAIDNINNTMGTVHGLVASANATTTTNGDAYHGNLAVGTTVEDHLVSLDTAIGDMRNFDTTNTYAIDTTNVAANLTALDSAVSALSLRVDQMNAYTDSRVETLDKNLSSGIASAVALSSVAVGGVRRGEMSVGAGYGYFNGQSAAAFGAAVGLSSRWSVNAGAGLSGYDVSFRAGTNFKFKVF